MTGRRSSWSTLGVAKTPGGGAPHPPRRAQREAGVHGPRTAAAGADRSPRRHLRRRHHAVGDAGREADVAGDERGADRLPARRRPAVSAAAVGRRPPRGAGRDLRAGPRPPSRPPLPDGRRHGDGSRSRLGRRRRTLARPQPGPGRVAGLRGGARRASAADRKRAPRRSRGGAAAGPRAQLRSGGYASGAHTPGSAAFDRRDRLGSRPCRSRRGAPRRFARAAGLAAPIGRHRRVAGGRRGAWCGSMAQRAPGGSTQRPDPHPPSSLCRRRRPSRRARSARALRRRPPRRGSRPRWWSPTGAPAHLDPLPPHTAAPPPPGLGRQRQRRAGCRRRPGSLATTST